MRGWRNGMKQVRWRVVQIKCFRVGRVLLLVAVGSLRNAARKLQVTIKDDRSVVREKMRRTPFSLMLDKISGQQRKVPR